jgi:1,2-diacylglycerol 3-alpha-glucosyltransferase
LARRIAMVIDAWDYPFNGTVVSTRRFVQALRGAGWNVRLLAIGEEGGGFEPLSIPFFNGVIRSMRVPLGKPDRQRIARALDGCDLLHVQFPFFLGHAAIGEAERRGMPVICSFHVQPENILFNIGLKGRWLTALLYRFLIWAFYRRATLTIAPSAFAADLLRSHGHTGRIEVLSNGVPESFFALDHAPRDANKLRVLSVGRLAAEKQQDTLLHAVARSRHRDRIELTLAGAGPREEALKALNAQLGLNAAIGPVSDEKLRALYAGADLFVHAGAVELEGMSVLEAMAAGLPVVVSDSAESAAATLVQDGRARFQPRDEGDLTKKLDFWLGDNASRGVQGEANRRFAEAFTHERSVAQLEAIYESVLTPALPLSVAAE